MSSTSKASDILKVVEPDIYIVIVRFDLAVNFAKLDGRSIKEGLRHFANDFAANTTDRGLIGILGRMSKSIYPEGFRPQLVAYHDKVINRLARELGVER